jgi:class 3 adenylate cyclase
LNQQNRKTDLKITNMATINLNSILDFFETGISYCAGRLRDFTPIIPYSFVNLKDMIYTFTKTEELVSISNKSHKSYLKNIPAYALANMDHDVENLSHIHQAKQINNGIYYTVLVDLVGSTRYLASNGNEKAGQRIINFVQAGVSTFINCEKVNKAYFLKEIGDSILFIFTHASDIVKWHEAFTSKLNECAHVIDEPYEIRTCVHLGEVYLHDANPLCLSVSETFKMEKQVQAGKIVFSELAAKVAAPTLNGSSFKLVPYNSISMMQELRFKNTTS